jgi:hypothetical protein
MSSDNQNEIRQTFNIKLIQNTINNINKDINKDINKNKSIFELELYIMTEYPEFYNNYPFLVKKLCKKDDMEILYKMFNNLNDVELGNKTLSNVELSLGDELAKQFIYPKINK